MSKKYGVTDFCEAVGLPFRERENNLMEFASFVKCPTVSVIVAKRFNPEHPPVKDEAPGTFLIGEGKAADRFGVMVQLDDLDIYDEIMGSQAVLIAPEVIPALVEKLIKIQEALFSAQDAAIKEMTPAPEDEFYRKYCPDCGRVSDNATKVDEIEGVKAFTFYCPDCEAQKQTSSRS